jgi:hypothetical protein
VELWGSFECLSNLARDCPSLLHTLQTRQASIKNKVHEKNEEWRSSREWQISTDGAYYALDDKAAGAAYAMHGMMPLRNAFR